MTMRSDTSTALPISIDGLTAEWFSSVLPIPSGVRVARAEVDVESIIWGTATKVFVSLTYAGDDTTGLPTSVCVKGGFNPDLLPMASPGYLAEARFFTDIAPSLAVDLPRHWFAGADDESGQGIVVFDDLRNESTVFPTMTEPVSADVVARALDQLASIHAATWGGLDLPGWVTLGSPVQRGIIQIMLGREHWDHHMGLARGDAVPDEVRDRERVAAGFQELWSSDDTATTALSHGDAHVGNLYLAGSDPAFLDWQGVCRAPWSDDVAYLIGGALSVEDRREHERDLLVGYLSALRDAGVEPPDLEHAWDDYRRHQLHGFVWLLVPDAMQPEEVCAAMGERYAVACADHDVFGALGV